jgi:lycopene cyclase domain-containing protein
VLGLTLGWVPLEEYVFFVLQTFLTGLLLFALARRLPPLDPTIYRSALRPASTLMAVGVWLASVAILVLGWKPATYLGLELAWALPPIALQLAVGADILWRHRRAVILTLASVTLYLCAADFLAIGSGVWTIDPKQSLGVFIGGVLPVEEVIFFMLTNTLIVFGLTLSLAPETWVRWGGLAPRCGGRCHRRPSVGRGRFTYDGTG